MTQSDVDLTNTKEVQRNKMTDRELATILCALRFFQIEGPFTDDPGGTWNCLESEQFDWLDRIRTHFDELKPLNLEEINKLCDTIWLIGFRKQVEEIPMIRPSVGASNICEEEKKELLKAIKNSGPMTVMPNNFDNPPRICVIISSGIVISVLASEPMAVDVFDYDDHEETILPEPCDIQDDGEYPFTVYSFHADNLKKNDTSS